MYDRFTSDTGHWLPTVETEIYAQKWDCKNGVKRTYPIAPTSGGNSPVADAKSSVDVIETAGTAGEPVT